MSQKQEQKSKQHTQKLLEEEIAQAREELSERVDSYLEYVSEEWMTENQLAVEHGLKTELTESFLAWNERSF